MTLLQVLQGRLRGKKVQFEDRSESQPGHYFLPKPLLAEIFPSDDVRRALAEPPFGIPLHRHGDACDEIIRRGLVVFAIVVDTGLCLYLDRLIEHELLDNRLPFSKSEVEPVLGANSSSFLAAQHSFVPHQFERHAYHRRLHSSTVLPYTYSERFGGGRCSKVYKVKIFPSCNNLVGTRQEKEAFFIRKEIDTAGLSEPGATEAGKAEAELLYHLRALKHENIVELLTSYSIRDTANLLFRCADCDLGQFLQGPRPEPLRHSHDVLKALHGLSSGLRHLHEYRLGSPSDPNGSSLLFQGCHHDLKPKNVLVQGNAFILSDFGLSRLKDMEQDSKTPWQNAAFDYGAPECRDPDTFRAGRVGRASDVWSLACIVLETLTYVHEGSEGVQSFKKRRRFEGRNAITYAFHHDRAESPAVASQIEALLAVPAGVPGAAIFMPRLQDLFSLQPLDRPGVAVVESRLAASAIQTLLTALLDALDNHMGSPIAARTNTNFFRAQMSLEIGRLRSWGGSCGALTLMDELAHEETKLQLINISKAYRLLDGTFSSLCPLLGNSGQQTSGKRTASSDDDMLSEIHQLNNRLHTLLGEAERVKADQFLLAVLRSVDDEDILHAFSTEASFPVTPRTEDFRLLAAMRYMASLMQSSRDVSARLEEALLNHDKTRPIEPLIGPSFYWYHWDHVQKERVHVEYIKYGTKLRARIDTKEFMEIGEKLFERINRLSALLRDVKKPADLRSLDCIGAFHSPTGKQFGLVYRLPNQEEHLITLCKLLEWRRDGRKPPDLDEKYCLAHALAAAVNCMHLAGWVHKNLNPLNIVFSHHSRTELGDINYGEPFLIGFDHSRPEDGGQYTEGPDEGMRAEYQHPSYRCNSERFNTSFDYYALGLILLEVGTAPLAKTRAQNSLASPKEMVEVYRNKCGTTLLTTMGKRYANATLECLRMGGTDVQRDEMVFQTSVLPVLRSLARQAL
ncbi:hypothetical protein QBC39DRAFT_344807 [Podospora conica]|nr:hypothetical protein QBC39DRAFT_344807 [Schizothecium conicum]